MFLGCRCCAKRGKIAWSAYGGTCLFNYNSVDDILFSSDTNEVYLCDVIVEYFCRKCPSLAGGYLYSLSASEVKNYVENGGIYITNCEWTNCDSRIRRCDEDGEVFNQRMQSIGCSLRRGKGTISTNPRYISTGSALFEGSPTFGNATSEITGGVPLLLAQTNTFINACAPENEIGGVCCAGEKIGKGAVIGFGDSNVTIYGSFRENILSLPIEDMF
jgi:hypothetical protein